MSYGNVNCGIEVVHIEQYHHSIVVKLESHKITLLNTLHNRARSKNIYRDQLAAYVAQYSCYPFQTASALV